MQLFLLDDLDDAENHHCVDSYSVNHYFDQKKLFLSVCKDKGRAFLLLFIRIYRMTLIHHFGLDMFYNVSTKIPSGVDEAPAIIRANVYLLFPGGALTV